MEKEVHEIEQELTKLEEQKAELVKIETKDITDEDLDKLDEVNKEIKAKEKELHTAKRKEAFEAEKVTASLAAGEAGVTRIDGEDKEISSMVKRLSVAKAFATIKEEKNIDGVEKEFTQIAHAEMEKAGVEHNGQFGIPSKLIQIGAQKDLNVATEGADIVETTIQPGVIPVLKPNPVLTSLGMQSMMNLVGNPQFPRETNQLSFTYEGEQDTSAETTPTLDNVKFTPHRLAAHVNVSIQTLKQSPNASEQWLRNKISREYELKVDATGIGGSGSGDIPAGILNIAGIGSVAMGTNGAVISYAKLVELEEDIETANASAENLAYLTTPGVKANMRNTPLQGSGVEGNFIVSPSNSREILGYRLATNTQVPSNLTKGTGTNLHAAIFGDFSQLALGMWGGFDILYDPYTAAKEGTVVFHVNGYNDFQLFQPSALSAIQDIVKS